MTAWDFFNMHTTLYVVSLAIALAAIVAAREAICSIRAVSERYTASVLVVEGVLSEIENALDGGKS